MKYWLMKSEPSCFSIDDLANLKGRPMHWDGVRNYQARNMLRDEIKVGDVALFYHSNCDDIGIVGTMTIVKNGYPDFTAEDPEGDHYDPKHTPDNPRWYMVDVAFKTKFKQPILLNELRNDPRLYDLQLLKKGNRLSVMPVSKAHYDLILAMQALD